MKDYHHLNYQHQPFLQKKDHAIFCEYQLLLRLLDKTGQVIFCEYQLLRLDKAGQVIFCEYQLCLLEEAGHVIVCEYQLLLRLLRVEAGQVIFCEYLLVKVGQLIFCEYLLVEAGQLIFCEYQLCLPEADRVCEHYEQKEEKQGKLQLEKNQLEMTLFRHNRLKVSYALQFIKFCIDIQRLLTM